MYKSILCRLCLYKSEFLINIFEENGKHGYIAADVIEDLLRFKVRREDGFPQQVCTNCLDKLTDFKVFKGQCFDSHVAFKKEFPADTDVGNPQLPSSSVVYKQYEEELEEVVIDDYLPSQAAFGHVNIKIEKQDDDEDLYDSVETTEVISADVEIKTECSDEEVTCGQSSINSEGAGEHSGGSLGRPFGEYGSGPAGEDCMKVHQIWLPDTSAMSSAQCASPSPFVLEGEEGQVGAIGKAALDGASPSTGPSKEMSDEFPCPQCGKKFIQLGYLNKHIRVTHNGGAMTQKNFECETCKMRFAKRGNLERHSMVHTGVRSFSCARCKKSFFHQSDLQAHMNSHTKISPYVCDYCQKGFSDKLHMIEHVYRHTGHKPFPCSRCNRQFGTLKNLKLHEKIHEPNPTYRCEECDKTFTNRVYFLGHQRKHKGELFGCLECGKTFIHKYSLKQHETLHKENGGFCCEVCGKKFDKKTHLRVHMMIHTGERPFECKYCAKRFMVLSHLRVHLKLHTGERSFYCDFCGKGFIQKSHYVDHVRIHTGERPFACTECNRAFSQRQQLKQHMKIHNKSR